jgi:ubiquinone/menaquinone biosynthesis C-methylase UbiE
MSTLEKSTYIFDVGDRDKLRLGILNDVYNPHSQRVLLGLNLSTKKTVIDMACGQGEMTCWLAKQIHPEGIVIGIDVSDEQLSLAKQLAEYKKIQNVRFINKSIFDLNINDFPGEADLIYCRWLLIHLYNEKITTAMNILYSLLAKGGTMVHEEVALQEGDTEELARSYKLYHKLFERLANKLNINFNLGALLPQLFTRAGYQQPITKLIKPTFSQNQLQFFQIDLESAIPAFEQYEVATKDEIYNLIELMHKDIEAGFQMTMTNYFVYGSK